MKNIKVLLSLASLVTSLNAQIYTAKPGETSISFHSEAPIENIDAMNKIATIVLKSSTNDIQISMNMNNFKFKNSLMEEHFNENYVESSKYPKATFKGKINEPVDYLKPGETKVTITGKMELHGVTKEVTMDGTITNVDGNLKLFSRFPIRVADYDIKVPSMYVKNIAEVVEVTFKALLEPYKAK
jgi:polyisoprenoid-binding protein YceI